MRPVAVTPLPPDQGTLNTAPQTNQATPSARHENPAGTHIVSFFDREREILGILHASELKRFSSFTYPEINGQSAVKIILKKASAEEIESVTTEMEALAENSNGRNDVAWRAKMRALVLDHLAYPMANRVLAIGFPHGSTQPSYAIMDVGSISIDPKTGVIEMGGGYIGTKLTEAEAVKRFGHLFQMKEE